MRHAMSWIHKLVFLSTLATLFGLAALALQALGEEPAALTETAPEAADEVPGDLGRQVRAFFFDAIRGDAEAMARALELLEARLAEEPDHPEALVYHGSLQMARSGEVFEAGDEERGMALWMQGLQEMDRAVEVAPHRLDVRIPRGATLLFISREVPPEQAPGLLRRSVEDYGAAYEVQKDDLELLSTHSRGELLLGLADGYQRLGQTGQADALFRQVVALMPETEYAQEAQAHLDAETVRPVRLCFGCHREEGEESDEEAVASR